VAGFAAKRTVGFVGRITAKVCETRHMQRHQYSLLLRTKYEAQRSESAFDALSTTH